MMRQGCPVCLSNRRKNWLGDENGKGAIGCESGTGLLWGVGWGVRERERGDAKKHAFGWRRQYTFIISRTFARGRYSTVCNAFRWFGVMQAGFGDDVVVGVG